jgi:hypothetical protein
MVVNFRTNEISRDTRKLARILTLKKKKKRVVSVKNSNNNFEN